MHFKVFITSIMGETVKNVVHAMVYNFNFYSLCLGEGTAAFPFPPHIVLSRSPCFFPSTDGAGVGEEIYKKATANGIAKS